MVEFRSQDMPLVGAGPPLKGRVSLAVSLVVVLVPCSIRSVLKHGPRSLTCARVNGCLEAQRRNEGEALVDQGDGGCLFPL